MPIGKFWDFVKVLGTIKRVDEFFGIVYKQ